MSDTRISGLAAQTGAALAGGDLFPVVDVADTTMAATGTNKKITYTELLAALSLVYQPLDSDLTAIAALTTTAFGRGLLALADAAALRTSAGLDNDLGTFSVPASTTISAYGATLVDDADAATARTTLGLGNAATLTVDADLATFALPASTTISAYGATLVDDADAATARTTLGLGTAATTAATAYATAAQGTTADTAVQPARSISTTAPLTGGGDLSANRTLAVSAASDTAAGVVELATDAETITGTDTARAVTPATLAAAAAAGAWAGGGSSDPLDANSIIVSRIFAR